MVDSQGYLMTKDGYYLKDSDDEGGKNVLTKKQRKMLKAIKKRNGGLPSVRGAKMVSDDSDYSEESEEEQKKVKYNIGNTPN